MLQSHAHIDGRRFIKISQFQGGGQLKILAQKRGKKPHKVEFCAKKVAVYSIFD